MLTLGDRRAHHWHHPHRGPEPDFLARAENFARFVASHAAVPGPDQLRIAQFRDPWSGIPLIHSLPRSCPLVYEVNGLPSIELPTRYPRLPDAVRRTLASLERRCLDRAAAVLTPSATTAGHLSGHYDVPPEKITVVPNGADIPSPQPPPADAPGSYLIYFGALQPWQGLPTLLRAFAQLPDLMSLRLVVAASGSYRPHKRLRALAAQLRIADRVLWIGPLEKTALSAWLQNAILSVAPLSASPRNLTQGCCPLKIIESMAAGTPVVASDLPVTRELVYHNLTALLVPPDRPAELALHIRHLVDRPALRQRLAEAARLRVSRQLTWDATRRRLAAFYRSIIG